MTSYSYDYPRPTFTCDTVVFAGPARARKVLLIQRGAEPFVGCWALPGGFIDEGERPVEAARRELAEETGLIWEGPLVPVGAFGDELPENLAFDHAEIITTALWRIGRL